MEFERPVFIHQSPPKPVTLRDPVGTQMRTPRENAYEKTRAKSGPSAFTSHVTIQTSSMSQMYGNNSLKKPNAVQNDFRDKTFDGKMSLSINGMIRDYELCAKQTKFSKHMKAELFINVFTGAAHDFPMTIANMIRILMSLWMPYFANMILMPAVL